MKYNVDHRYVLRGWKDKPYVLVDLKTGESEVLDDIVFQTFSFCINGIDFDSIFVLEPHKKILSKMLEKKVIYPEKKNFTSNYYQKYKLYEFDFIDCVHWSITKNCNLKCKHCYMKSPNKTYNDLSLDKCKNIIMQIFRCGIKKISITGGEPFVRVDFWEIIDEIIKCGIHIKSIYTNGYKIDKDIIENFKIRNIKPEFSISFDSLDHHDWLRGVKDASKKTIEAFKLLKKNGFKTSCEVCIYKNNLNTIEKTVDLLSSLGISFIKINKAINLGNWFNFSDKYGVIDKDIYDVFLEYIPRFLKIRPNVSLQLGGFFYYNAVNQSVNVPSVKNISFKNSVCDHAKNVIYLNSKGEVLPCPSLDSEDFEYKTKITNSNNLENILKNSSYKKISNLIIDEFMKVNKKCSNCMYKIMCCGGCRANAKIEKNSYLSSDPQMCTFFKEGYFEKLKKVLGGVYV